MQASKETIAAAMPAGMRQEFADACRRLDMAPSEAIRLFAGYVVKHKALPFVANFKRTENTRESIAQALDIPADGKASFFDKS